MSLDTRLTEVTRAAFKRLGSLQRTVTFEQALSRDEYGLLTYAAGVSRLGYIVQQTRRLRLPDGSEVVSRGTFLFPGPLVASTDDRLTLPDGTQPPILRVYEQVAGDGTVRYTEVTY